MLTVFPQQVSVSHDALTQRHGLPFESFKWWNVSAGQVSLLTMHITGLAKKMHLFWAYVSLIWFATYRKVRSTFIQEEFTALETQGRGHTGQVPKWKVVFCSLWHSYGRWQDQRAANAQNVGIKSDSLSEAQFLDGLQLWQIQLQQHSQLLSQCSALPFSKGYHPCTTTRVHHLLTQLIFW